MGVVVLQNARQRIVPVLFHISGARVSGNRTAKLAECRSSATTQCCARATQSPGKSCRFCASGRLHFGLHNIPYRLGMFASSVGRSVNFAAWSMPGARLRKRASVRSRSSWHTWPPAPPPQAEETDGPGPLRPRTLPDGTSALMVELALLGSTGLHRAARGSTGQHAVCHAGGRHAGWCTSRKQMLQLSHLRVTVGDS